MDSRIGPGFLLGILGGVSLGRFSTRPEGRWGRARAEAAAGANVPSSMDPFIVVVALLLVVLGTAAALAWWYLVKRAAPYRDEQSRASQAGDGADAAEVIVLPPSGAGRPGGRSES